MTPHPLLAAATELQPRTVALRRALHRHPEQGLLLPRTQAAVLAELADVPGLEVSTGRSCSSVVGVLTGARPGPTVLLRGDMDALPLPEDTGLPFASEVAGSMHACGHDAHVAMLASAARLLSARRDELAGRVVLMFQPGEEGHHGARTMIDDGVLDIAGRPVSALALHVSATVACGQVQVRPGPMMASTDTLRVTVTGRGGHASAPDQALDPVSAAAATIGALATMVGRRISVFDPAVVTVAHLWAGTTHNIIPETAHLEGTLRCLSEDTRALLREEVRRVCLHTAAAHGCTAEVVLEPGYPVTVNDPRVVATVQALARSLLGAGSAPPMENPVMGAEDFAYVLAQVPGAMAFLGASPPGVDPAHAAANHSNRVVFDEDVLASGVALLAGFALGELAPR
ncbi:M20 family metallopeptidase [Rhodococcus antarcticus]|uniref:M20 family metallopeptidase n=1 Tax=Rhodococcus antarcticus TaxID=2987751 RepID=A0ABY6NYQ7_9NOCA|nr:M20 family metallopeptidase [Rhodococcus antarcticus]UZJ24525.1 M20 family metallopeptidase [Rhodococcus antarcticus]